MTSSLSSLRWTHAASQNEELARLRAELRREEALASLLRTSAGRGISESTPAAHPSFSTHEELARLRAELRREEAMASVLRTSAGLGISHSTPAAHPAFYTQPPHGQRTHLAAAPPWPQHPQPSACTLRGTHHVQPQPVAPHQDPQPVPSPVHNKEIDTHVLEPAAPSHSRDVAPVPGDAAEKEAFQRSVRENTHQLEAEQCRRLYLEGRLEGFEVLEWTCPQRASRSREAHSFQDFAALAPPAEERHAAHVEGKRELEELYAELHRRIADHADEAERDVGALPPPVEAHAGGHPGEAVTTDMAVGLRQAPPSSHLLDVIMVKL